MDLSRVHKGRRKQENTRSLVNDKRAVAAQRRRYEQYSVVVEEVPLQPGTTKVTTTRTSTTTPTTATRWAPTMQTR